MGIKNTFREKFATGAMAASLLGFSGCGDSKENRVDLINIKNPNAIATSSMGIHLPDKLKSDPQKEPIDLTDVKQVAAAMGVKLDDPANPDPVLYNITFNYYGSDGETGFSRKLEVRVSNAKQGAEIINSVENNLISKSAQEIIKKHTAEQATKAR